MNTDIRQEYLEVANYMSLFATLNVLEKKGEYAPHKPVLLLTIISLIEGNVFVENKFPPMQIIKERFNLLWDQFVPEESVFSKAVWTPYWHLQNEPFWHFKPIATQVSLDILIEESKGQTASIGKIRDVIDYAYFDEELYTILQKDNLRHLFKQLLIDTYL